MIKEVNCVGIVPKPIVNADTQSKVDTLPPASIFQSENQYSPSFGCVA
jgi:hypothetical protein